MTTTCITLTISLLLSVLLSRTCRDDCAHLFISGQALAQICWVLGVQAGGLSHPAGPFLGNLAFHRSVAATTNTPFPDVSLSEDLYFVEQALSSCNRMLPLLAFL